MLPARSVWLGLLALASGVRADPPARIDFVRDVQPILQRHCLECHGPDRQRGKLRLDTRAALLRSKTVVPGKSGSSELVRRITLSRDDPQVMPARGAVLSSHEIVKLRRWIDEGAVWPDTATPRRHWAHLRPVRPALPSVRDASWPANSIDRFVLARLDREGLTPSPPAERVVLLRRLYLDLVGLPPSPEEADAFLADTRVDALDRVIDRLLASPGFGERWARHWLDLARYADSHGFQRDDLRDTWPYRDWVIDAFNADLPFDRFTIEQLAGDLLPRATQGQRIATGFHRGAVTNVEAGSDPEETRTNQIHDRIHTTATVWLGSTLECAQCHDHKYDPFTQREYYQLFAFFNSTALEADRARADVPGSIRFLGPRLPFRTSLGRPANTLVMQELPSPRTTRIFLRGDFRTPGAVVEPGVPSILPPLPSTGTRNRLTLARWLVQPDNPLVARVQVNRIWAELFGQGLVTTPEDFGIKGEPPSHPDLLDWLAVEYVEGGWSLKSLVRLIVQSRTYQQSSRLTPQLRERDDRNRLLARGPRFRLDAEAIRDGALAAAGLLWREAGGPPIRPPQPAGLWRKVGGDPLEYVVSPEPDRHRRGIYVVWKRSSPHPGLMTFGVPARLACAVKRSRSSTPLQALTLLNDPVHVEAAKYLARRVLLEREGATFDVQLRYAFRLCLVREPTPSELAVLRRLHGEQLRASKRDPDAARDLIGAFAMPADVLDVEFVPWYAIATVLLNLDETITKG